MNTPAGWYPTDQGLRYWDGSKWTEHFAASPADSNIYGGPGAASGRGPAPEAGGIGSAGRSSASPGRASRATWIGWGGLALVALLGALSSGVSGVFVLSGIYLLVVGVVALMRGHVDWARLRGRAAAGGAVGAAIVLIVLGGATANPTEEPPVARPAASSTASASPSPTSASPSVTSTTAPTASATSTALKPADGTALAALAELPVKGRAAKTGYSRAEFGQAWFDADRNGCDTRNDILRRDLRNFTLKAGTNGCLVLSGTLVDPYTGNTTNFVRSQSASSAVQIDHVVALADAWQKGAQQLSLSTRTALANDPLNLLAVTSSMNEAKGDGDAATWLPPRKSYRCAYVARQVAVKVTYHLWVAVAEKDAIARILQTCPSQKLPAATAIPLGGGRTQAPAPTATPAPTRTSLAVLTCKARVSPSSPSQYSTVTVTVTTGARATVTATAHYKTTDTTHTGTAGSTGIASIPFKISRATIGYPVLVDVTASLGGRYADCSTSFTPAR